MAPKAARKASKRGTQAGALTESGPAEQVTTPALTEGGPAEQVTPPARTEGGLEEQVAPPARTDEGGPAEQVTPPARTEGGPAGEQVAPPALTAGGPGGEPDDTAHRATIPWMPWEKRPEDTRKKARKREETTITKELVARAKEAFSMYDYDNDGAIDLSHVLNALRNTGYNPAENEVKDLLQQLNPNNDTNLIEFNEFLTILPRVSLEGDTEEEQEEAFSVWDPHGTGNVNVQVFRRIMTTTGETITSAEVDEMMKHVTIDEKGQFKYNDLIRVMLSE